ncbi:MAG TPA: OsmC family protein [Candidatus Limnocylindrales bacterium]|nr:OsmC family protein [Candidatus Limnocylindrales bacterium]
MAGRQRSYQAEVQLAPEDIEAAVPTTRVVIRHHRAPSVAWSIESASGGHVLHLALAQCVFNNVMRIAQERGLTVSDVGVTADGDFNDDGTASTGITCAVKLSGAAEHADLIAVAEDAFADSSVVAVLSRGGPVELVSVVVAPGPRPAPSTR